MIRAWLRNAGGRWQPDSRVLSALELALGAAIVIGHNVYRVVPNEVPILFGLGLLSLWLRNGGLRAIGFRRPESWTRILLIAIAAAAIRLLLGALVIEPLGERIWGPIVAPEETNEIAGHPGFALLVLLIVWTFAAFGEEIAYRGYLMRRAADLGRGSTAAYVVAIVITSVLFGIGHFYKGPAGMLDSGIAGLLLGLAWLAAGRNMWACVLAHGFIDTYGLVMVYFGWDS